MARGSYGGSIGRTFMGVLFGILAVAVLVFVVVSIYGCSTGKTYEEIFTTEIEAEKDATVEDNDDVIVDDNSAIILALN